MAQGTTQLTDLLRSLDLAELIDRFLAADIDDSLLRDLTESDLRELGLTLGQRKKVFAGLGQLRGGSAKAPAPPRDMELRRLTVLFCDLVGSSSLAETIAPDEMHEVLRTYYQHVETVAAEFGGHAAAFLGDGAVVIFGFPKIRPGNADRALAMASALQHRLATVPIILDSGREIILNNRIGVASGRVAVGYDMQGGPTDTLQTVGPVMNLAARLQTIAPEGGIVVDAETRNLAGPVFRFDPLPMAYLKGFEGPIEVALYNGRDKVLLRDEHPAHPSRQPIGRDDEITRIEATLGQQYLDRPNSVLIWGDAGMGKTCVLNHIVKGLGKNGATVRRLSCNALGSTSALRPILDLLIAELGGGATRSELADLLDVPIGDPALRSIARALHISVPDMPQLDALGPADLRRSTLAVLSTWLLRTQTGQAAVVIEDMHWADATTRDLVSQMCDTKTFADVHILMTSRSGPDDLFGPDKIGACVELAALPADAAASLVAEYMNERVLPETVQNQLLGHASGNPLMLEVLCKSLDGDDLGQIGADVAVPASIYESISERLDQIGNGQQVVEALAVLEEVRSPAALAAVAGLEQGKLDPIFEELSRLGILETASDGRPRPRFRHRLYRDVLYEKLIKSKRRKLHALAARALMDHDPDIEDTHPEILAWHFHSANDTRQAARFGQIAGETALGRSAYVEAAQLLELAAGALDKLPVDRSRDVSKLAVLTGLAAAKRARLGIGAPEVGALGHQILALAEDLGDQSAQLVASLGLYSNALVAGDFRSAATRAEHLQHAAEMAQDRTFGMIAKRARGSVAFHLGQHAQANDLLDQALASYDRESHGPLAKTHGYDHAEITAVFLGFSRWSIGDPVAARDYLDFAVSHSRDIEHAHSLVQALAFRALLGAVLRDLNLCASGTEAKRYGQRHGLPSLALAGGYFASAGGVICAGQTVAKDQLSRLEADFDRFKKLNPLNYAPLAATIRAQVFLLAGRSDLAMASLQEGLALQDQSGEVWAAPELYRIFALAHLDAGNSKAAQAHYGQALATAQQQGATGFELRIACDLAERTPGRETEDQLLAVLSRMRSDDGGWDLRRARSILGKITPSSSSLSNTA
mgnify:CR=1 FL=1